MLIRTMCVQVSNKRQKTATDADERRQPMQDITNTVAHTPALSDVKVLPVATQEQASQVFCLEVAVVLVGPFDNPWCLVPLRLTLPISSASCSYFPAWTS